MRKICRFVFENKPDVVPDELDETVQLAILAAGFVLGEARVRLDFGGYAAGASQFRPGQMAVVLDVSNEVGLMVACLFTGFAMKEYGDMSFRVFRESIGEGEVTA